MGVEHTVNRSDRDGQCEVSWAEPEQWHVVQRCFSGSEHGRRAYLNEQHLYEELHSGREEMAGMAEGRVFLQPEAGVDVGQHTVGLGVVAKVPQPRASTLVRWTLDQTGAQGSVSRSQVPTISASAKPAINIGM